jgi:hypothetical protein
LTVDGAHLLWLYYRLNLSHRDIEDLVAQRGIVVSREAIRLWCIKFGGLYARRLKRKHRGYGDTFQVDEVFAGVPDHSDQWQAALPMESRRPGCNSEECVDSSPRDRRSISLPHTLLFKTYSNSAGTWLGLSTTGI